MDRINLNNYEAYFLDYHEGSLSQEEQQEVLAFLQENPELFDSFEDFDNLVLTPESITYPDKSELFRSGVSIPESDEWEYLCIAYMEGDLAGDELDDFEKQLKEDQEKAKVLELFLSTKSMPDTEVVFEDKQSLKKKVVLIPRWAYAAVSSAAILVLGWILFSPGGSQSDSPQFAEENKREVLYINKIAQPDKYYRVASADFDNKSIKGSKRFIESDKPSETGLEILAEEDFSRDVFAMASLESHKANKVESFDNYTPSANTFFAFRYIPSAEDDEYQTLLAFSGDFIRKQLLDQDPELVKRTKFSLWELADAGLERVSNTFGTRADIEREYSESGELLAVTFESPLLGFNTPVRRRSSAQID